MSMEEAPMANRYEEASDAARKLLENFDEIDLAEMLASSTAAADTLNARIAELEAEREKADVINAQLDAKTDQKLNDATEVVQYLKARAEQAEDAIERVLEALESAKRRGATGMQFYTEGIAAIDQPQQPTTTEAL